jgi:hypothetical protein
MVILATDYREECVVQSKDRLNGLCKSVGLARSDFFLGILWITEGVRGIADDISACCY